MTCSSVNLKLLSCGSSWELFTAHPLRPALTGEGSLLLTCSFLCFSSQVDRQSPYVQGYRLFYRPSGGTWHLHDINSPSERSTVLSSLLKGTEYELKIRPYFDEFQGRDSRTLLVRTTEEGKTPFVSDAQVSFQGLVFSAAVKVFLYLRFLHFIQFYIQ